MALSEKIGGWMDGVIHNGNSFFLYFVVDHTFNGGNWAVEDASSALTRSVDSMFIFLSCGVQPKAHTKSHGLDTSAEILLQHHLGSVCGGGSHAGDILNGPDLYEMPRREDCDAQYCNSAIYLISSSV